MHRTPVLGLSGCTLHGSAPRALAAFDTVLILAEVEEVSMLKLRYDRLIFSDSCLLASRFACRTAVGRQKAGPLADTPLPPGSA